MSSAFDKVNSKLDALERSFAAPKGSSNSSFVNKDHECLSARKTLNVQPTPPKDNQKEPCFKLDV